MLHPWILLYLALKFWFLKMGCPFFCFFFCQYFSTMWIFEHVVYMCREKRKVALYAEEIQSLSQLWHPVLRRIQNHCIRLFLYHNSHSACFVVCCFQNYLHFTMFFQQNWSCQYLWFFLIASSSIIMELCLNHTLYVIP